jgi:hypothetical protein
MEMRSHVNKVNQIAGAGTTPKRYARVVRLSANR